jgi:hypothetical protein
MLCPSGSPIVTRRCAACPFDHRAIGSYLDLDRLIMVLTCVFVLLTVSATGRSGESLLATSLLGDVAAALREDGSATLDDEHCCYFRRPD